MIIEIMAMLQSTYTYCIIKVIQMTPKCSHVSSKANDCKMQMQEPMRSDDDIMCFLSETYSFTSEDIY